ncbi:MAG: hypothetical protein GY810_20540 [Aureispira sp.]|nr:hypothetical protein [Aureispira sp.]
MKYIWCLIFSTIFILSSQAQSKSKLESVKVGVAPIISLGWNLYHWYQRPNNHEFSKVSGHRSAGQALNVLPSCRIGALIQFDTERLHHGLAWYSSFFLTIEGGIDYTPFSFDMDERKGQSAITFPVQVGSLIPFSGSALTLGLGVQFSRMEFNRNTVVYEDLKNPFFVTYFLELGIIPHEIDGGYSFLGGANFFVRVGLGDYEAVTINLGFRGFITFAPEGY